MGQFSRDRKMLFGSKEKKISFLTYFGLIFCDWCRQHIKRQMGLNQSWRFHIFNQFHGIFRQNSINFCDRWYPKKTKYILKNSWQETKLVLKSFSETRTVLQTFSGPKIIFFKNMFSCLFTFILGYKCLWCMVELRMKHFWTKCRLLTQCDRVNKNWLLLKEENCFCLKYTLMRSSMNDRVSHYSK